MVRSNKKQNRIKKDKYQSVNSDSDNDRNGDFDPRNPFAGDEIEDFNLNQDKVLKILIKFKLNYNIKN